MSCRRVLPRMSYAFSVEDMRPAVYMLRFKFAVAVSKTLVAVRSSELAVVVASMAGESFQYDSGACLVICAPGSLEDAARRWGCLADRSNTMVKRPGITPGLFHAPRCNRGFP